MSPAEADKLTTMPSKGQWTEWLGELRIPLGGSGRRETGQIPWLRPGSFQTFKHSRLPHTRVRTRTASEMSRPPFRGILGRFPQADDRPGRYPPPNGISSCWALSPCWERHSTNRSGYRTGENSSTLACKRSSSPLPPREGALAWTRRLAEPIHEAMMADYRQRHKAYREEKSRWDSLGKKNPIRRSARCLLSRCSLLPVTIPAPACWRTSSRPTA